MPEVIYTSQSEVYLHLPGVIVTQKATEVRYLLSDGLGSIRQAVDETGAVVAYHELDPYGNPVVGEGDPYGYTGEWWEDAVGLLHLRARWYMPETGTFLSVDPVESEPPYLYVRGNVVNWVDPSGMVYCDPVSGYCPEIDRYLCTHTPGAYDRRGLPCAVNSNGYNLGNSPPPSPPNISPSPPPKIPPEIPPNLPPDISPTPHTQNASGVSGYLEGINFAVTLLTCVVVNVGVETVYDFNTGQRATFTYSDDPNVFPTGFEIPVAFDVSYAEYFGFIWGFDRVYPYNQADIVQEYSGHSVSIPVTGEIPFPPQFAGLTTANFGVAGFSSATPGGDPTFDVTGVNFFGGFGGGAGIWDTPFSVGDTRSYSVVSSVKNFKTAEELANSIRYSEGSWAPGLAFINAVGLYGTGMTWAPKSLAADVALSASRESEWIAWKN